jgi:hypothetical protein
MADQTSILDSIKKLLGLESDYTAFDQDIILHINSVFSILYQIGASPLEGVTISDNTALWEMYLGDRANLNFVKTYMYLKVRLWFDPPTTSFALTSMQDQVKELEWRLNISELKFNPYAYSGLDMGNVYIIDDDGDFPPDAPIGALGFDPDSGKIWRNT